MQYPSLDLEQFNSVLRVIEQAQENPEYLDPAVCPYDEEIVSKIKKLIIHPVARATVEEQKNPVGRPSKKVVLPIDEVEKEVDEIRKEISQLKLDAKGLETADRIQIIKTRAALVEKIIAMKERITNIKLQRQFINEVIAIMEDILDQKQQQEMIKRLEPYLEE